MALRACCDFSISPTLARYRRFLPETWASYATEPSGCLAAPRAVRRVDARSGSSSSLPERRKSVDHGGGSNPAKMNRATTVDTALPGLFTSEHDAESAALLAMTSAVGLAAASVLSADRCTSKRVAAALGDTVEHWREREFAARRA